MTDDITIPTPTMVQMADARSKADTMSSQEQIAMLLTLMNRHTKVSFTLLHCMIEKKREMFDVTPAVD